LKWEDVTIENLEEVRSSFASKVKYDHYCDESVKSKSVRKYQGLISHVRKEKWEMVEYSKDPGEEDEEEYIYSAKWKSNDSESLIYLKYTSDNGDGAIGLDTKDDAIIVGAAGAHPTVSTVDFAYLNSDGSGPCLNLKLGECSRKAIEKMRMSKIFDEFEKYLTHISAEEESASEESESCSE